LTNVQKMRGIPYSIGFNVLNSFFVQFTFFGSIFVLFLNELGLDKAQIGFLLGLLPFFDAIAIFISNRVARFGYKRTFLTFWGLRNVFTALMLFTPWVLRTQGSQAVLTTIALILTVFSISRSIAVTGLMPWQQEYIPNAIRGKYSATNTIFTNLAGFAAITAAGFLLGEAPGINHFILLYAIALLFGAASIWVAASIPGGKPVRDAHRGKSQRRALLAPLQDRNFLAFLLGDGLVILAVMPLTSFVPLFMREQVGLSSSQVVLLQSGTLIGGLLSGYLWGWAADRYGSRPVMLLGVVFLGTLPLLWLVMPRQSEWSLAAALGIAFVQGVGNMSWGIGSGRLFYVSIVPPEKKTSYMAVYTAWVGIITGLSQALGGQLLNAVSRVTGQIFLVPLNPYNILFLVGLLLALISLAALRRVQGEGRFGVGEFAGLFFHGNPLLAFESLIRYHFARDEGTAVSVTERLGQARSPLTVDELLEALEDPRFYVRFEALISIARRGSDERLHAALVEILQGREPSLSVLAAWALGRIGDRKAIPPLRDSLSSGYRSVQAHAIRSLGTLEDAESAPLFLARLAQENDLGLRMAYSSALGKLESVEATPLLLKMLAESTHADIRRELALALARILGQENRYIQLHRSLRQDPGTALAKHLTMVRRKNGELDKNHPELHALLESCTERLAQGDLGGGIRQLAGLIDLMPREELAEPARLVLEACARDLRQESPRDVELATLALLALNVDFPQY
jgi:MFS family permease